MIILLQKKSIPIITIMTSVPDQLETLWMHSMPYFKEFVSTPNISPGFSNNELGNTEQDHNLQISVLDIIERYIQSLKLNGNSICYDKGSHLTKSPFMLVTIEATKSKFNTVGFYAHADKQPPLTEKWDEGLDPYKLIQIGDKLYGRGTVDDGYALFTIFNLIKCMQDNNVPHDKYIIMIETSEESGSCDLSYYLDKYSDQLQEMSYLICMDSGGPTNDRLWFTQSLRGCFMGVLDVKIGDTAIHSGDGGGIIPSPYRITNLLLNRIEDARGKVKCFGGDIEISFNGEKFVLEKGYVPNKILESVSVCCQNIDEWKLFSAFPIKNEVDVVDCTEVANYQLDEFNTLLNNMYSPSLTVIGMDGLPSVANGGNIISPHTSTKLSIRIPPTVKAEDAMSEAKEILESNPPHNASVSFTPGLSCDGWIGNELSEEIYLTLDNLSKTIYGNPVGFISSGGSIPIMGILQKKLPQCNIMATGVLTSESNAHGPNEVLCLNALKKFTICMYTFLNKI